MFALARCLWAGRAACRRALTEFVYDVMWDIRRNCCQNDRDNNGPNGQNEKNYHYDHNDTDDQHDQTYLNAKHDHIDKNDENYDTDKNAQNDPKY